MPQPHNADDAYRLGDLRARAFRDFQLDLQANGQGGYRLIAHFGWPVTEYPSDGSYTGLREILCYLDALQADFVPAAA